MRSPGLTSILQKALVSVPLLLVCLAPQARAQCGMEASLTSSAQSAVYGVSITFTAIVMSPSNNPQPIAGASISFLDSGVPIGGGTTDQNGAASFTVVLEVGTHTISASLLATCVQAVSASISIVIIAPPASSVIITFTPSAPTVGQPVTVVATIVTANANPTATGTIQFFDGKNPLSTVTITSGQASITVTLTPGAHAIIANYSGDATYPPAAATFSVSVYLLTTSLALTSNTSSTAFGQPVTFTATVTPTQPGGGLAPPTGQVQFFSGCICGIFGAFLDKTLIGTANVASGAATVTVASLPAGTAQVFAIYSGDGNWGASTSNALTETIGKAASSVAWTSLSMDSTQERLNAHVTFLSGSPSPTGTMQFIDTTNNSVLATANLAAGVGTVTLPAKPDLTGHPLLAAYSGDANYNGSISDPADLIAIIDVAGGTPSVVAPDEIVSIFGSSLASAMATAPDPSSPPTSLAGATVQFVVNGGTAQPAALLFASPTQINLAIPAQTVLGLLTLGTEVGTITVTSPAGTTFSRNISLTSTAPTIFLIPQIIRVRVDGSQDVESAATPIDLSSDTVYLVLYGTGIRLRPDMSAVTCIINGLNLPVAYAGPQSQIAGLDQVNVPLPASLKGSGQVNAKIMIGGQVSNSVTLTFQ